GFMAHVGTIRKIVGAELAHEKLIEKSSFVAGAARCIEDGFVRRSQSIQLARDEVESFVPRDWLIVIAARRQEHGMSEASLLAQPVIRLAAECGNAPFAEEFRSHFARGSFFSDRLGAVLAILVGGALAIGIGPSASGTIETVFLIQHAQRIDPTSD